MATYPVNTVNARTHRVGSNSSNSVQRTGYSQIVTNGHCAASSILSQTSSNPSKCHLREARLQRFAEVYETDKKKFVEKEKKKNQEKLLAKLERYKGVGEVGKKLSPNPVSEEDKLDGHLKSRVTHQQTYDKNIESLQDENFGKVNEGLKELTVTDTGTSVRRGSDRQPEVSKELTVTDTGTSVRRGSDTQSEVSGQKLGGNLTFNRARGEHPLLAKLSNREQFPNE